MTVQMDTNSKWVLYQNITKIVSEQMSFNLPTVNEREEICSFGELAFNVKLGGECWNLNTLLVTTGHNHFLYTSISNFHSSLILICLFRIVVTTYTKCCNIRKLSGFPTQYIYISHVSQNTTHTTTYQWRNGLCYL